MTKIKLDADRLEFTMLIPLYSRAKRTICKGSDFKDHIALKIFKELNYDFRRIQDNYDEAADICIEARTKALDYLVDKYIQRKPYTTIVNIGAGLDTPFNRLDNGKIFWYDLDLPDAIKLRRKFIKETDRNKFISRSMFDYAWFDEVNYTPENGILFVASGVLMYFHEDKIKNFFIKLAERFPGGEFVFDAITSRIALITANRIMRSCGSRKVKFQWYLKSSKILNKWDNRVVLLNDMNYFDRLRRGFASSKLTKLKLYIAKLINAMKYYHLKFLDLRLSQDLSL